MKTIPDLIRDAIQDEIKIAVEAEAKEAAARVEKRVKEMTMKIATNVLQRFDMEVMGEKLKITVDFEGLKK